MVEVVAARRQVAAVGQLTVVGFVVRGVHHGRPVDLEAVAEGQRRMVEVAGGHA